MPDAKSPSTSIRPQRFQARRIIVTGAASGIGRATAEAFAAEGAKVAWLDMNTDQIQEHSLQTGGMAVRVDVSQESLVQEAVKSAATALSGIDVVVNCAGVVAQALLGEMTLAAWNKLIGVNLTGTFLVTREALPWLKQATTPSIVNIASNQALKSDARLSGYAASKAGILALTRSWAAELGPFIRVNCVCPGTIETPMTASVMPLGPISNCVMGRMGHADEIARTILFLSSNEASFITGTALAADGGRTFH